VQQRAGRVRNPRGAVVAVVQDPALEAEQMGMRAASAAPPIQAKPSTTGPIARSQYSRLARLIGLTRVRGGRDDELGAHPLRD
jgi:hypothetical protein